MRSLRPSANAQGSPASAAIERATVVDTVDTSGDGLLDSLILDTSGDGRGDTVRKLEWRFSHPRERAAARRSSKEEQAAMRLSSLKKIGSLGALAL